MMVAFAGFLRYDDASHILAGGVRITSAGAELQLPKRKTDQHRTGGSVWLQRGTTAACPVALLQRLLAAAPPQSPAAPLFRAPQRGSGRLSGWQPWSYSAARAAVLGAIAETLRVPSHTAASVFGLHSLRSGGATAAATTLKAGRGNVPQHVFMAHGGWRTAAAMQRYIQPSTKQRGAITAAMRL
jgi:hypothetical protein